MIPLPLMNPKLIGLALIALALTSLTAWALFERSRYFDCRASSVALAAQEQVLAEKLTSVSDQVRAAAQLGRANVATTRALLEEAKRLAATPRRDVSASEAAAAAPAPAGKGCPDALAEIRAARATPPAATESGRAR